MGNCLPSHRSGRVSAELMDSEEFVMVMRSDGKIMEYMAPILVRDLMAAYPQHSIVHSEDATCCSLSSDKKLFPWQLYRLLLIPNSPSVSKDAVLSETKSIYNGRISRQRRASTRPPSSVKSVEDGSGSGTMTVKMVISKRELEAMLSDRSMKENSLLLQLRSKAQYVKKNYIGTRRCSNDGWRPSLESVPEMN